ncbi:hypothetical protein SESBI_28425 [Sesbania bispinosa]|nr:hypothetical protein SESBI_28425 [Sesbania bispinosa]
MATMQLESLSIIRSSTLPPATFSSPIAAFSLSGRRSSARLPHCTGLKLQPVAATRFPSRSSLRTVCRGARVVCEAQNTAVEG